MTAGEVWLIANPAAGSGRGARHASVATRALVEAGIPCRLLQPGSAAETTEAAAEAVRANVDAVVACGGDGTVHAVIQALAHTDTPLGILAAGSGDDIAACLGFPSGHADDSATHLIHSLQSGATRQVDLGHAQTSDGTVRHYLGVLSTGFDSSVNERANAMRRMLSQRYNIAIIRELASFKPLDYDLRIDDVHIEGQAMLVAVGNGSRYGGGMLVCPAADMVDGQLDVTWLGAVSKLTFLRALPTVFTGKHVRKPFVHTYRGRRLVIGAPGQIAYADGERIGPLPVEIEVRPGALRVLAG